MTFPFPSATWLEALIEVLNTDNRYAQVAKNWEGDILVVIDPDDGNNENVIGIYLDLWHGTCRGGEYFARMKDGNLQAAFIFRTEMVNIIKLFKGELDPMQAMLTRRLRVDGPMAYLLRNVPTVLDFIRCCRRVPMELA